MYDDDYDQSDSRRLSYLCTPLTESISVSPISRTSSNPQHPDEAHSLQANGRSRPPAIRSKSYDKDHNMGSSGSDRSPGGTATSSFPLNDIDYESDPAAVAQELSNLAAIRRMSMDAVATGDPDLPSFSSDASVSLPPSPSADENDASRLFWVPARLHPELAPMEFKSFLESKAEQIKRRSGDSSLLGKDLGKSLQRKRSKLSRQIDNPVGYMDGAERLERKRSDSKRSPNLQDLETLVDNSKQLNKEAASLLQGIQNLDISADEDRPILPPAPPGHSLRRSTRTQYRKGGSKKGERPLYSKRHARTLDGTDTASNQSSLGRVSTDPTPSAGRGQSSSWPHRSPANTPSDPASQTPGPALDHNESRNGPTQFISSQSSSSSSQEDSGDRQNAPGQRKQRQSHTSTNGRSIAQHSPSTQGDVSAVGDTLSVRPSPPPGISTQQNHRQEEHASTGSSTQENTTKWSSRARHSTKESRSTLSGIANTPQALPGNNTRTDTLSIIPTMTEDKKSESKKSKDKKEEGGRKSSWHWLLGSDEKDKEKKKDKDGDSKKHKNKSAEKVHDAARLDVLQSSIDGGQRGRESLILDRSEHKLEEERRKDSAKGLLGDSKKEKESGLFSSIFGGVKKKSNGDGHHKKHVSRNLSPDPPVRELRPDIDYAWSRFSILEERAIYRMAHIKLANPRRALYSQVLLSNFMYSYLAKVQQMHPTMMMAAAAAQRQQKSDQTDEYLQYQRYQEVSQTPSFRLCFSPKYTNIKPQQQMQFDDNAYDNPQMYEYDHDNRHDAYGSSRSHSYDSGSAYGPGHYQQYNYANPAYAGQNQLDDDDDDMF